MNLVKSLIFGLCLLVTGTSQAVYVNESGSGEVLIYPYYTVNNNQNTFYSIINTTIETKALKITFREGENGAEVLTFNIYLSAFDVWTGSLGSTTSTYSGHIGEPTVLHVTNDSSCAPFLNKAAQQFLPFVIDQDPGNSSLLRATEGYLEVMEMSTFNGGTVVAADHGINGIPASCGAIQGDWADNGIYDTFDDETAPTGGLMGQATLLDLSNGNTISYEAMALDYFWQGEGDHTEPGSLSPNLSDAMPNSLRMINGNAIESNWSRGVDAVSAALMQYKLFNEYDLYTFVAAKTEWVVTFPTKFMLVNNGFGPQPPFTQAWDGNQACETTLISLWDSNEVNEPATGFDLCYSVNVMEFILPGTTPGNSSELLGSINSTPINTPDQSFATENGWAELSFQSAAQSLISGEALRYDGLPVSGFAVKRFINAGAGPGLLAIYADSVTHKTQHKITLADLIFIDGFENN